MTTINHINQPTLTRLVPEKKSGNAPRPADRVEAEAPAISGASVLLANAEKTALSEADIDQGRVDRIREAIANGELAIDYDALAQKMLDFEFSLFDH